MAIYNGHNYRWAIGDESANVVIAKATACNFDVTSDTIETSHKDTTGGATGWKNFDYGGKTATGSVTYYFEDTDSSWETLYDNLVAATKTNFIIYDQTTTGTNNYWKGSGCVTNISVSAPNNEPVEMTANWQFDGAITKGDAVIV